MFDLLHKGQFADARASLIITLLFAYVKLKTNKNIEVITTKINIFFIDPPFD